MKTAISEFEPLEIEKATDLEDLINRAARQNRAVLISRDESGLASSAQGELLSPNQNTNGLARYQRHY